MPLMVRNSNIKYIIYHYATTVHTICMNDLGLVFSRKIVIRSLWSHKIALKKDLEIHFFVYLRKFSIKRSTFY